MKIEDYLTTLPESILSGEDVQLPKQAFREIFKFANLRNGDVFYHLGCGDGTGLVIAKEEFNAEKIIGIDISKEKTDAASKLVKEKNHSNIKIINEDIVNSHFDDADVILFWFVDDSIIEKIIPKFSKLKQGVRIITIWGPLTGCLPEKVKFPYIMNKVPFTKAKDLKEQLLSIFNVKCIDFVTSWEFAERYTKAIGRDNPENDRFLTIIQSLIIWINAKNLGVSCENDMPEPIKNYISILKKFFNIEIEHLLK